MATIQRIYPRLSTAALSFVRRPVAAFGEWDQINGVFAVDGARYVGPSQGTAQTQAAPTFGVIPAATTRTVLLAQVLSDPLAEQVIEAGDWQIGFAAQLANAAATYTWSGYAALYVVDGLTGQRRATVFNPIAVGSMARTATAERTCLDVIAGNQVQARVADYLCLEIGLQVINSAASLAPQASLFAEGTTPITSDNVATADAMTVLEAPQEVLLSLPQAGEQPDASVTHAEAVQLIKDSYPPYTGGLYPWDYPHTVAYKIFQAFGDILKLYGYDQVDRIQREVSPLTCVELLPAWEAALGITLSETALRVRSVDMRRNLVLARLREVGPLTVYNVAAIFGRLAGYVAGTAPEVIALDHATQYARNVYSDTVNDTIPTGTGFDATNLIRWTPTLLDGGEVWKSGVRLDLRYTPTTIATENIHVQLTAPDYVTEQWTLGPNLSDTLILRSQKFNRGPVHGPWKLNIYREIGVPFCVLLDWRLYVLGRTWGGRSASKLIWSVFLDAAHQSVDRRDIETTLDRITQSYTEGFCIFDKTSIPGTRTHRAGRFIPGA